MPSPSSHDSSPHHHHRRQSPQRSNQGAFAPLLGLPRRRRSANKNHNHPVFHFTQDDEHEEDFPEDSTPSSTRRFFQDQDPTIRLTPPTAYAVPFPRSSPPSSSPPSLPLPPAVSRSSSHPVLLSNGRPLKSSLKSSPSAPTLSHSSHPIHHRARSEPSTPSQDTQTAAHKNVHFAEKDGLATVRVFHRSGRPAALSHPPGADDTETETESEYNYLRTSFPFPPITAPSTHPTFELELATHAATSPIPQLHPSPYANIHLESIALPFEYQNNTQTLTPVLTGTLIVRNIAYQKHVAVRFTVDNWQTTSEVSAHYISTLPCLPPALTPPTVGDAAGAIASKDTWDRFTFGITLEHYAPRLHERVLWLAVRFNTGFGGGEWWDNNNGDNYRVCFKTIIPPSLSRRAVAVSALTHVGPSHAEMQSEKTPVQYQSNESHSPPQNSPPASVTTMIRRVSKLSLLNYAAPSTTPTTHPPNFSPNPSSKTQPPGDNCHMSSLYALLSSPESSATEPKRHAPTASPKNPTIMGGHPISYFQPASSTFNQEDPTAANGINQPPRSLTGFAKSFGIGGTTLRWPWSTPGSAGIELGPDEAEIIADFQPENAADSRGVKEAQSRTHHGNSARSRLRSGSGSGTSSSTNSSDEAPTPPSLTPPVKVHKGGSSASSSRDNSPKSPSASALPTRSGRELDTDSVRMVLVKQWCFAEGSPPVISGDSVGISVV